MGKNLGSKSVRVIIFLLTIFLSGLVFSESGSSVPVRGTAMTKNTIIDGSRKISYYFSQAKSKSAPLLLMIQGSGCIPVMNIPDKGMVYSTMYGLLPLANEGDFSVMAVEKPYSGTVGSEKLWDVASSCSKEFHEDFTAESWIRAISMSLADVKSKYPEVVREGVVLFGFSEGAVISSVLSNKIDNVKNVILFGGSGTVQLYDFILNSYQQCETETIDCVDDVYENLSSIRNDPSSFTQFAWGHPYKRWSSFFKIDPVLELLKSSARVYIAFGMNDRSTPPLSQELAIAQLRLQEMDVTARRVPGANHMMINELDPDIEDFGREIQRALEWVKKE